MNRFCTFLLFVIMFAGVHAAHAQNDIPDRELVVTDEQHVIIFTSFAASVVIIFLFLARDIIFRRKTSYDTGDNLESKKDKTFEKYHSDWGDDYEELGQRKNTKEDKKFRDAAANQELPDYYGIIGVSFDATHDEIKQKFRERAMKTHPDKTKKNSEDDMAELNKAYEVLSNEESRERYDKYYKSTN